MGQTTCDGTPLRAAVQAIATATDDDFGDAMFRVLGELARAWGGNGAHLVLVDDRPVPPAETFRPSMVTVYTGHHPSVGLPCLVYRFKDDLRWLRLTRVRERLVLRIDDPRVFPELRQRLRQGLTSALLIVPIWFNDRYAGYFLMVLDQAPVGAADDPMLETWCHLVAQSALLRRTNASLQGTRRRLESLIELSDEALFVADSDVVVTHVSSRWTQVTGWSTDETVGKPCADFVHPDDLDELYQPGPDDTRLVRRWRLRTADGSYVPCEITLQGGRERDNRLSWTGVVRPAPLAAPAPPVPGLDQLTAREQEIVDRLRRGQRVRSIARDMYLSEHTVRNHLKRVFRKLGVSSQADLIDRFRVDVA